MELTILKITALIALVPASLIMFRRTQKRDGVYWSVLAVAVTGTLAWVFVRQSAGWSTGISTALWLTILACLLIYAVMSALSPDAWRLTPLLMPYLLVLGILALFWEQAPEQPLVGGAPLAWIGTHIVVSVATYGLITLAAVAALAAALQEKSLKSKHRSALTRILPSLADSEFMLVRLLIASEIVLALGLLTGIATLYFATGEFIVVDHKTLFTIAVFFVVGGLLLVHMRTGIRGRTATRMVLLAYLLLTLGYPGVKFVTDILMT